jgi:polyhydroxyalkanoate synthesis regulator phasin
MHDHVLTAILNNTLDSIKTMGQVVELLRERVQQLEKEVAQLKEKFN